MDGVPRHLALIPSGTRRWAHAHDLDTLHGQAVGVLGLVQIVGAAWSAGVETVTVWLGNREDFEIRRRVEVGVLADWLATDGAALIKEHKAAFEIIGDWERVCPQIGVGVEIALDSAGDGPRQLILLCAFDGRREVINAARRVATGDVGVFQTSLSTGHLPPIDLLIRTGDSGYLAQGFPLWHLDGARMHFCPFPWPDFDLEDLDEAFEAWRNG
ncbi:MAG TPA: undecaprenyl diphosphate synthase family protein [Myxococcota bacterium]|nr:undecaprenyl diphosphate synthase family protein [Myxococcota bacterium]